MRRCTAYNPCHHVQNGLFNDFFTGGTQPLPIVNLPGTPLAIYSGFKLNPNYTGNAFRIVRNSNPSLTTDIGFVGTGINKSAIDAFDPSGIDWDIDFFYDQMGSSNTLLFESGRSGITRAVGYYDNRQRSAIARFLPRTVNNAAVGDTAKVGEASYKASITINAQSLSVYQIIRGNKRFPGRSSMIFEFGDIGSNETMYYEFSNGYTRHRFTTSDQPQTDTFISNSTEFSIHSFRSNGSNPVKTGVDAVFNSTIAALSNNNPTGFRIGQWSNSLGDFNMESDLAGVIIYNTALNDTNHLNVISSLQTLLNTSSTHSELHLLLGDSLTGGYGLQKDENWVVQLSRNYPSYIRWINSGLASDTVVNADSDRSARATQYLTSPAFSTTPSKKIIGVWLGTNDIALNAATGLATYNAYKALCQHLASDGFTSVWGIDIIPRNGLSAPVLAQVASFNSLLLADHSFLTGGFVQLSTAPLVFGTHYLSDGVHLNTSGVALVLPYIKAITDQLL